jgi:hypothetical protein
MLAKIEARLVPPPRKCLRVIIDEGDDEAAAKEKALAEHVGRHPEDAGRTVKDFNWIVWEIVHPKFIIGADGRVRWPAETIEEGEFEDTDLSEGEFEDADKDTDASETLRTGLDQAGSTPELDGKGGSHHNHEPIDLPPPDPGLARSKPWRPVHQRPARDQRRSLWGKNGGGNGHGG